MAGVLARFDIGAGISHGITPLSRLNQLGEPDAKFPQDN
jgi:hypothetical protein